MRLPLSYLILAFSGLAAFSPAQSLRAGANAQIVTSSGNDFLTNEQSWVSGVAGSPLTRSASVSNTKAIARTEFTSDFGSLKGKTFASLNDTGVASSSSRGTFESFSPFTGAGFFDTLTLTGSGAVSFVLHFSFHSLDVDPNALTSVESKFKLDTFSSTPGLVNNVGAFVHSGDGNHFTASNILISGLAGQKFDLMAEMSSFSTVQYGAGVSGNYFASSDATHTASVWIEPVSGGFTAASGSQYLEPVPEPGTLAVVGLGLAALARRRVRR